jgi:hypothetical protein
LPTHGSRDKANRPVLDLVQPSGFRGARGGEENGAIERTAARACRFRRLESRGLIAAIVNILWGLFLVGLALSRASNFPSHFTVWQIVNIVWIAAREVYVLITPDFMPTIQPLLFGAGEIAIGAFCIAILRRKPEAAQVYSNIGVERRPVIVSIIAAILGVIVGAVLGAGLGFFGGSLFADATHMSCFEGACGYFALFIGLFAMLAGAIAGGIFAVWWLNRRRPARPS